MISDKTGVLSQCWARVPGNMSLACSLHCLKHVKAWKHDTCKPTCNGIHLYECVRVGFFMYCRCPSTRFISLCTYPPRRKLGSRALQPAPAVQLSGVRRCRRAHTTLSTLIMGYPNKLWILLELWMELLLNTQPGVYMINDILHVRLGTPCLQSTLHPNRNPKPKKPLAYIHRPINRNPASITRE